MYRKINNNQKPEAKDKSVRQEAQLEGEQNSIQTMGNEAMNAELMNQMLKEMNAGSNPDPDEYEDREKEIIPFIRGNRGRQIPDGTDKLNDSDYLNSSHNIVNEDWLEHIGKAGGNASANKNNLISNEISESSDDEDSDHFISTSPKKEEKKSKKKPDQKDAKIALEIAENILEDAPDKEALKLKDEFDPLPTYAEDADLAAVSGRKKGGKKKGKKSAADNIVPPEAGVDNLKGIEDARWKDAAIERLMNSDFLQDDPKNREALLAEEMDKIKSWDFKAEKLDKIKEKPGKFRKFLTYFAGGMGKLLRTAMQIVSLGYFWRAKSMTRLAFTDTDKWQTKKEYQSIPGWDGAKYDPQATWGEDVLADFRRVPTVWSRLTAAKAAEKVQKDGREEEKPLDPIISMMVEQPVTGSS